MTTPTAKAAATAAAGTQLQRRAEALVTAETTAATQVSSQLFASLRRLWSSFGGYYDDRAVADFGGRAAKLVSAAQKATGQLTEQHLRRQLQALNAPLPRGLVVDLPTDLRMGALSVDVYMRPARTVRYLTSVELPDGADQQPTRDAIASGLDRLQTLAETDLQLARTTAAQQVMYAAPVAVTGYRRVIHPEISGQVCGLCIVAADRLYTRGDLMPLHPGCHCTETPVVGDLDPGAALNAVDLGRIYTAAGSTKAEDLRRTRVQVLEHGELGPVLVARPKSGDAERTQRTPGDVDRDSSRQATQKRTETLASQRDDLAKRLRRLEAVSSSDIGVQWLRDRIATFDAQLAS